MTVASRTVGQIEALAREVLRLRARAEVMYESPSTSYRDALTGQVMENGQPIGSLAELAHVTVTDETRNFQIQAGIADELRRWHVPPWARPHCSLDPVKMCTSWTCLVDRCARGDDRIAQRFHEEYERLAPMYAWTTQEASAVPSDRQR